jgi:hypothetical protein
MVVTVGAQHWASSGLSFGGADRDRTGGLLVANQALSQLSYSPLTPVFSLQSSAFSEYSLTTEDR